MTDEEPSASLDRDAALKFRLSKLPTGSNGEPLAYFTEGEALLPIGRSSMLYLHFLQFTWVFLVLIGLVHAPYVYFYYQNENAEHIYQRLSMANWTPDHLKSIVIATCESMLFIFIIVYVRFMTWLRTHVNNMKSNLSASDFSVHVRDVPGLEAAYSTKRLHKFFSNFGEVKEIKMALDSGNLNKLKGTREKYAKKIQKAKDSIEEGGIFSFISHISLFIYQILDVFAERDEVYHQSKKAYKCTGDVIVTFMTEKTRFKCLHAFNRPYLSRILDREFKFGVDNFIFRVEESCEPLDMIWENLEYSTFSKYARRSVSVIITLLAIAGVVSLAVVLEKIRVTYLSDASVSAVVTKGQFNIATLESIGISIALFIVSRVMQTVMRFLSSFEKHRFKSHTKTTLLAKLSLAIYLATVSPLPVYMTSVITSSTRAAALETATFYNLLFTMVCTSILAHPILMALKIVFHFVKRWILTKRAKTQEDLQSAQTPPKFKYEDSYSDHVVYIMIAVSFCGLFPVAIYIVLLGLIVSYFVDKFAILKTYAKIGKDKDKLMNVAVSMVALAWLMRYMFMGVRVYYYLGQDIPLTNPFIIAYIATTSLYIIFLAVHFGIMETSFIVKFLCYSKYKNPKYLASIDGKTPITEFPELIMYKPPLNVDEVKHVFYGEILAESKPKTAFTAVDTIKFL